MEAQERDWWGGDSRSPRARAVCVWEKAEIEQSDKKRKDLQRGLPKARYELPQGRRL